MVGMRTGAVTPENSIEFPQKVKNGTTLRPRSSTTRYLPKEYNNTKRQSTEWKTIFTNDIFNKSLVFKIYKVLI